jgi:putative ABC transport system substrate-binding protein
MSSFLEELRADLPNASGVAYEVPGVTAFVNLRSVIERPVARVGVLHRPSFKRFVERQKALAAKEQITLVPIEVPSDPSSADVRNALKSFEGAHVDALWVLNDNGLLKDGQFLEAAWRPELAALGVPVVVGVPTLVSADARFGTFAVLPDLEAMGVQAANVLFEISESGWRAGEHPVELPVSTVTVVNMRQVKEHFGLREGAARRIDKVIE